MNNLSRAFVIAISAGLCSGGLILNARDSSSSRTAGLDRFAEISWISNFEFVSSDLHKFSFAQLEEVVRADAATRFPNVRVELGSVKADRGTLTMNVVLFGPNNQAQAFLYALVPEKNSWKIASTHRLWFVPPTQIARGLRV